MKWSKFNHIMNCKYGSFIYNSTTNSFLKINPELLDVVEKAKNEKFQPNDFTGELMEIFISHHILVSDDYDEKYLSKLKFIYQKAAFADSRLSLTIATTTKCNFKCPYCYEEGVNGVHMDENTEKAIIAYIDSIKPKKLYVGWYGGEPLLNFSTLERLTKEIDNLDYIEDLQYSIVTNGSLLTEEKCLFFKEHYLKNMQITLDGRDEYHNRSRIAKNGKPTYAIILHNLDRALDILPECHFSIRVNVSALNREDYPLLYRELHERYRGKSNFSIYFSFVEDYNMCGNNNILRSEDRIEFLRYLKDVHHIDENKYPRRANNVCVACKINSFVIAPNGDLYKCWNEIGRKEFIVGNIKNEKMITNYDLICEYAVCRNKFNDSRCLDCFLLPVCRGGCPDYRYRVQTESSSLEICPFNLKHIDTTLELMYEKFATLP